MSSGATSVSGPPLRSQSKRHYKKDSRFVLDLYTLCYDENESVDTVELFTSIVNNTAGNWTQQRRNDREEIRRRLAMGGEEIRNEPKERSLWKSSIQSRLHNDSLQLAVANEAISDTESHSSDSETCPKLSKNRQHHDFGLPGQPGSIRGHPLTVSPATNNNNNRKQQKPISGSETIGEEDKECDFFTKQAKLQIEARMALAQAKEMAHMQMEIERQSQRMSPITAIIRRSLEKVGVQLSAKKRRVSRQMLTEMNIAQLQVLVNNLHTHIEELNDTLVHYLMERDDLHVAQDSMLVDIEELTRYIGVKEHIVQQERLSAAAAASASVSASAAFNRVQ